MPEKTHGRADGSCGGRDLLLELLGRSVAKRRVQAATIILNFDERFDIPAQVIEFQIIELVALILSLGSIPGAHFNPAVE